jgi:hypothetical protein
MQACKRSYERSLKQKRIMRECVKWYDSSVIALFMVDHI